MKKRTIDITSSILLEDIADEISMLNHESIIDFILMLDEKIEDMDTTIDLIIKLVKSIGATDRNIEDLKPFIEGIAYEKLIKGEIECLPKRK
jgi:hypothetical protein